MNDPAPTERRALRRRFRRARRALDAHAQTAHAQSVARHFLTSPWAARAKTLGLYLANDGELDPGPLLVRLQRVPRKRLALPVVRRDGRMEFRRYRPGSRLVRNRYGIPEPALGAPVIAPLSLDVLLVPLVAFDAAGTRLGMGAGYYDRFIGRLPASLRPRLIGLAHEVQRSPVPLPAAAWDVPLDGVITESGWQALPQ